MTFETDSGSLDRIDAPDLWNEAVERAAELGLTSPAALSRALLLVVAALLLALLAGAIAVGARLIRPAPDLSSARYANGMVVNGEWCGPLVGIEPSSGRRAELAPGLPTCATRLHVRCADSLVVGRPSTCVRACGRVRRRACAADPGSDGPGWGVAVRRADGRRVSCSVPRDVLRRGQYFSGWFPGRLRRRHAGGGSAALIVVDVATRASHRRSSCRPRRAA